jgi:hypothetical protein
MTWCTVWPGDYTAGHFSGVQSGSLWTFWIDSGLIPMVIDIPIGTSTEFEFMDILYDKFKECFPWMTHLSIDLAY